MESWADAARGHVTIVSASRVNGEALAAGCRRRGLTAHVVEPDGSLPADCEVMVLDLRSAPADVVEHVAVADSVGRTVAIGDDTGRLPAGVTVDCWVRDDSPVDALVAAVRGEHASHTPTPRPAERRNGRRSDRLTDREREVLVELLNGGDADQLAARLGISAHTVRTHVQNVLAKLGVNSRTEAAAWALREGLGSTDRAGRSDP